MAEPAATPELVSAAAMGEVVLRASGLGKIYARSPSETRRRIARGLRPALFGGRAPATTDPAGKEFWAVRDVSFELQRGRAIGVIGLNGSGKTTLLRMLAGQILPDKGEIWINGKTAAMIDLTAGFSPGAPGRRNIYMRAAALGFTRAETEEMVDEIIAFSELGDAIDAPMTTYSSGMQMRLAFSVMAMVAPDVLFIDEVLAVGDFRFRQKCLAKVREMRARSAFVFVSHSMGDIERFCDEVIVMHKGVAHFQGAPGEAVKFYLEEIDNSGPPAGPAKLAKAIEPQLEANSDIIGEVQHYWADLSGKPAQELGSDDVLKFVCDIEIKKKIRQLTLGVPVYSVDGFYISGFASREIFPRGLKHEIGWNRYELEVPPHIFGPGIYHSNIVIRDGPEHIYRKLNEPFAIRQGAQNFYGKLALPQSWKVL